MREKETKSGRARTVSLTGLAVEELRRHKARQAEELLGSELDRLTMYTSLHRSMGNR